MRLLLDTHVAIWAMVSPNRIPPQIAALIGDRENDVHVSVVSIWEIAIKFALRKQSAPPFSGAQAAGYFQQAGFALLPVSIDHATTVDLLPPHHGDPFDRLIVAQALAEPLRLVTHDRNIAAYSDTIITW